MKKLLLILISMFIMTTSVLAFEFKSSLVDFYTGFKQANKFKYCAGAFSSFLVHEGGHMIAMELSGVSYKVSVKPPFLLPKNGSQSNYWIDLGGVIAQCTVGETLDFVAKDSDFTIGFKTLTAFEILSYPLRNNHGFKHGDFKDKRLEYVLFSGIAINDLFQVVW